MRAMVRVAATHSAHAAGLVGDSCVYGYLYKTVRNLTLIHLPPQTPPHSTHKRLRETSDDPISPRVCQSLRKITARNHKVA